MFASTHIPSFNRRSVVVGLIPILVSAILLFPAQAAAAQQGSETSLEVYANAMKQGQVAEQASGLEKYLAVADSTLLKQDALEVLIWDYLRMGSVGHAQQRAAELAKLAPNNPVALAVLSEQTAAPQTKASRNAGREKIVPAQAALTAMEQLRKPEGMLAGDFAALRRHVESRLNGMLGLAYVDREEYQKARTPLQQAVAVDPQNPQYAYALGLALLYSKDSEGQEQNAFLYLARAVNLTQGTAAGQQIAEFARKQYHKAGGKDADWNQYLAAAVVPEKRQAQQQAVVASSSPALARSASSSATVASASPAPAGRPAAAPANATTNAKASQSPSKRQEAKLTPPALPPSSIPRPTPQPKANGMTPAIENGVRTPYAPVSLGILIETALLTKQNRPAILAALRDVINHLRGEDEAAILVFSNQLDFEQDLTANDQLLEQAIDGLRPRRSRALLDGIAFAAGHLKRIGKNPTRVLLVISDGKSQNISRDSMPLSTQISGVRVDCIGLNADGADERALLERLASYSGGQARFANGPEQFRTVAMEMTGFLGVRTR